MQNRWLGRLLATLALLTVIAGALWHFLNPGTRKPAGTQPPMARSDFKYHYSPPVISSSVKEAEAEPERDLAGQPKILRAKVEEWLIKHHRNATSLLAAFRALEDTNYLNEAATNFPDDPQVQWTILARNAFREDRRKWLDLFKASSPSNSLANYLSAQDYLKNGLTNEAINELLAASGKSQFGTYSMEAFVDGEELNQFAGKTPLESGQLAFSHSMTDVLTEDTTLKSLAWNVADLEKQQAAIGDNVSVENLARMGLTFADQIRSGENGKLIINQLIGNSSATLALSGLDQNTSYDFLGGQTPGQILQQIKEWKASMKELSQNFAAAYPNLTGEEMASYIDRIKIYGEVEAMRWVVQQHPQGNP
ncbi:MAG: hypothetical protein ABSD57_12385 [Verrucomicrobiota bacterium]|jgi:hypothetical protein